MYRLRSFVTILAAGAMLVVAPSAFAATADAHDRSRAVGAARAGVPALVTELDDILASPMLDGATISMTVRDATTGTTLYQRHQRTRLNPASNAKLFTSLAAMGTLGPRWRFGTDVLVTATPRHGTLTSNLYLRGGGDPTLLRRDLVALAKAVAERGVRRVRGDLVADDHYFDQRPFGPGWAWDDTPYYYSAVISGLTLAPDRDYDSGTAIVQASPGARVGSPVRVSTTPKTGVFRFVNHATTGPKESRNSLSISRDYASNVVKVTGRIPRGNVPRLSWVPVPDPTEYAMDVFGRALRAQGIHVSGTRTTGATPAAAHRLAHNRSMPVSRLLTPFLKLSNNMHAEHLTKTMGRVELDRGSTSAGTSVIRGYLRGLGIDVSEMRQWDGSGLSRFDLVSARTISDVLLAARDLRWFTTWYDALPVACGKARMVGGTLGYRMCRTPAAGNMHAKTGSLAAVSALSGYVTNAAGDPLVFSLLTSNVLHGNPERVEDAIGVALASWNPSE